MESPGEGKAREGKGKGRVGRGKGRERELSPCNGGREGESEE